MITVCPVCEDKKDLNPEVTNIIKTTFAFMLNRICPKCGAIITEEDIKAGN